MKTEAIKLFHGREGFNCAQAVLKTFQERFNLSEGIIKEASSAGGGRAKDGMCGALYAVKLITEDLDPSFFEKIKRNFKEETGSTFCREIRRLNKLSCRECVALAAENLENYF